MTTVGEKISYAIEEFQRPVDLEFLDDGALESSALIFGIAIIGMAGASMGLALESESTLRTATNVGLGMAGALSVFPGALIGLGMLVSSYAPDDPYDRNEKSKWQTIGSNVMKYSSLTLAFTGAAVGTAAELSSTLGQAISTYTCGIIDPAANMVQNIAIGTIAGGLAPAIPVAAATGAGITIGAGLLSAAFTKSAVGFASKALTFPFRKTIHEKASAYREQRSIEVHADL